MTDRINEGEATDLFDPLIIFVEGGTTNGEYLINFKKGAFMGLNTVFPKLSKFHSCFQTPSSGVIEGLPHYVMATCIPFAWCEIIHLPVFRPNEYLWKNH